MLILVQIDGGEVQLGNVGVVHDVVFQLPIGCRTRERGRCGEGGSEAGGPAVLLYSPLS